MGEKKMNRKRLKSHLLYILLIMADDNDDDIGRTDQQNSAFSKLRNNYLI